MSYYTDEFNTLNSLIGALGSDTLSAGNSYELDKIALLQKLVSIFGLGAIASGQSVKFDGDKFIPADFADSIHSHADATDSVSGFLSATDKAKLDNLDLSVFAEVGHIHSNATPTVAGFLSGADKTKLDLLNPASYALVAHNHAIGDLPEILAREDENNYFAGSQQLQAVAVASSNSIAINANTGTWFVISPLSHNVTIQIPTFTSGKNYRIILSIQQPATPLPIDWSSSFKFQNRAKPIAAANPGGWDEFLLICPNGLDWLVSQNVTYGSL